MILLIYFILLFDGIGNISTISKENSIKSKAEEAFLAKDYASSVQYYSYLLDTLKVVDEKAALNLSHAYFQQKKYTDASKNYEKLYNAIDKNIRSIASQQLGVMAFKNDNDKPKALSYFKDALKANPTNKDARFNYEFLKRLQEAKKDPKMDKKDDKKEDKKEEEKKDKKDDQNKDGKDGKDKKDDQNKDGKDGKDKKDDQNKDGKDGKDKKDDQNKDGKNNDKTDKNDKNGAEKDNKDGNKDKEEAEKNKKDKKGEQNKQGKDADNKDAKENKDGQAQKEKDGGKKDKQKTIANPEALAKMGMTDQRAKMLLDAMKSNEVQYIQQNKREATKKNAGKGKPDW